MSKNENAGDDDDDDDVWNGFDHDDYGSDSVVSCVSYTQTKHKHVRASERERVKGRGRERVKERKRKGKKHLLFGYFFFTLTRNGNNILGNPLLGRSLGSVGFRLGGFLLLLLTVTCAALPCPLVEFQRFPILAACHANLHGSKDRRVALVGNGVGEPMHVLGKQPAIGGEVSKIQTLEKQTETKTKQTETKTETQKRKHKTYMAMWVLVLLCETI